MMLTSSLASRAPPPPPCSHLRRLPGARHLPQEVESFTKSLGELLQKWEPMYSLLGQLAEFRLEGLKLLTEMSKHRAERGRPSLARRSDLIWPDLLGLAPLAPPGRALPLGGLPGPCRRPVARGRRLVARGKAWRVLVALP